MSIKVDQIPDGYEGDTRYLNMKIRELIIAVNNLTEYLDRDLPDGTTRF